MKKHTISSTGIALVLVVLVAVCMSLFVPGRGTTETAASDEIPDRVSGGGWADFQITMGQPGSMVSVTCDIGKLSKSAEPAVEEKTIGQIKQLPDSKPTANALKQQSYKVDGEGVLYFKFFGDTANIGKTATITVCRQGDKDRIYRVMIGKPVTPEETRAVLDSIGKLTLLSIQADAMEGREVKSLVFKMLDAQGNAVVLPKDHVAFLRCEIVNSHGTNAYLFSSSSVEEMMPVQTNDFLIDGSHAIVPIYSLTAPILVCITVTDEDGKTYRSENITVPPALAQ